MKITRSAVAVFTISPLALSISIAQARNDSLSLNGFTGLITVPNAHVTEYGTGIAAYSDMMYLQNEYRHNNNVIGSFGIFPHLEVSGRIAWFNTHSNLFTEESEPRDLSANIKLNIPYIPDNWFELAIGKQDIGGEASYFDTTYVVASKNIGPFRFDIGYGSTESGDRLNGEFAGIEFAPFEWVSLLAEYDAQDVNTGFRLSTPENWLPQGFRVDLTVLADTSQEASSGRSFYGINVKFPLGGGFTGERPKQPQRQDVALKPQLPAKKPPVFLAKGRYINRSAEPAETMIDAPRQPSPTNTTPRAKHSVSVTSLRTLRSRLQGIGFDNVDVGTRSGNLIVAFENNIYNRSELDALGVVLAVLAEEAQEFPRATVILRNQRIGIIAIDTNPKGYKEFLEGNAAAPIYAYYPSSRDQANVIWHSNSLREFRPKPRITVSPMLNSGIATEFGVWDYSFGAAINGAMHLWPGAIASVTYTQELDNSEDFSETGPFRNAKIQDDVAEMSIQQGFKIGNLAYHNFQYGKFRYDYEGVQNQTLIHDKSGKHQVSLRLGDYKDEETEISKEFQLLSYRYYWSDYDVVISTTAGEFWDGDKGYRVNSLFRFGDQTVELFYKDVKAPITDEKTEFIGMAWTLPLTPKRDWDSKYLQVKGNESWRWGLQTRINNEVNNVAFGIADIALPEWTIERAYLNNDKLSPEYIYNNLIRIKNTTF